MATSSTPNTKSSKTISLNLLVDNSSNKVVFAEARKEFVDFLFGLLQIPHGSIMGLLWNHGMASGSGLLSNVYQSIQNLDPCYIKPNLTKDSLLWPNPAFSSATYTPQMLLKFVPPNQKTSTEAQNKSNFVSSPSPFPASRHTDGPTPSHRKETGYVRDGLVFVVMEDLTMKPMSSTISTISLLNDLNIKDISSLQEKKVEVDLKKGLELVKASFNSTTVLTDVFLGKKTYGIPLMDSSPPASMSTSLPQQETPLFLPLFLPSFKKTGRTTCVASGKRKRE